MATKLKPGSTVKREVTIRGFDVPFIVTLSHEGFRIAPRGSRVGLEAEWPEVIRRMPTPLNISASFYQRPYELMVNSVNKVLSKRK